jgi:hypothetical protein
MQGSGNDVSGSITGNAIGNWLWTDGDPALGALADNGGPTQTMRPLPGSPVIDAIACTDAPATDQRGVPRPQFVQCDIGAVEYSVADDTVFADGFDGAPP